MLWLYENISNCLATYWGPKLVLCLGKQSSLIRVMLGDATVIIMSSTDNVSESMTNSATTLEIQCLHRQCSYSLLVHCFHQF